MFDGCSSSFSFQGVVIHLLCSESFTAASSSSDVLTGVVEAGSTVVVVVVDVVVVAAAVGEWCLFVRVCVFICGCCCCC